MHLTGLFFMLQYLEFNKFLVVQNFKITNDTNGTSTLIFQFMVVFKKDYSLEFFHRTLGRNRWQSSSFEGYTLQVRHKQDWGRGFILVLPQTAVLPESDAGDVIKPASSFVIQNRQTSCSMWCPMYRARC